MVPDVSGEEISVEEYRIILDDVTAILQTKRQDEWWADRLELQYQLLRGFGFDVLDRHQLYSQHHVSSIHSLKHSARIAHMREMLHYFVRFWEQMEHRTTEDQ